MATDEERVREHITTQLVANVPRNFLEDFDRRAKAAYLDRYLDVKQDRSTIDEQRASKLIQDRMFRMEWELAEAAKAYGLPTTSKLLPENTWAYTYVSAGTFGITQCYVQTVGALPIPAMYRKRLAKAADCPRLPLDDCEDIYQLKEFYALLAHNPIGRRFQEDEQKLGTLQLCIPCRDMNGWTFAMNLPELLSYYPAIEKPKTERGPTWRSVPKRKTENK